VDKIHNDIFTCEAILLAAIIILALATGSLFWMFFKELKK
jgi:hypothetical protein